MIYDYLENIMRYKDCLPKFEQYRHILDKLDTVPLGKYEINQDDFISVMTGETVAIDDSEYEYHRHYLDIQIVLEGQEVMKWANTNRLEEAVPYDESSDIGFNKGTGELLTVKKGMFYIVFPEDSHMPGRHIKDANSYKKAVIKIKLN